MNNIPNCARCKINQEVQKTRETGQPACCIWLMDNVICGEKLVEDCTKFDPIADGESISVNTEGVV